MWASGGVVGEIASQVSTALSDATLDMAKGNLEGQRAQYPLQTNDQLFNAQQFKKVIVAYSNGAPVELKDIAKVVNSSVNPRTGSWLGTTPAELLLIETTPGANTLQVVDRISARLPQLLASIPRAVHVDLVSDRSLNIRASVSDVEFAGMYFLNYSIDNLSMMGLTIAVGFLVDDAIVMIENVVRYIEEGDHPFDAALKGSAQIGFTIVSMTLSLMRCSSHCCSCRASSVSYSTNLR